MKASKKIIVTIIATILTTNSIFASPIVSNALIDVTLDSNYSKTKSNEQIQNGTVIKNVNLRTKPNQTSSTIIRTLKVGETVQIVGSSGDYYKIKYDGNSYGYAFANKYIEIKQNDESDKDDFIFEQVQNGIVVKNVNLRTKPNKTSSTIIRTLKVGETIQIVGTSGDYYKVKYDDNEYGYAFANKYIEIKEEIKIGLVIKNVNLRTNPDKTTSQIIKTLQIGDIVQVVGTSGDYYKIKYDDSQYGYAFASNYVEIKELPTNDPNLVIENNEVYYLNEDGSKFTGGFKVVDGVPFYFSVKTGEALSKIISFKEVENDQTVINRYYISKMGGYLKNSFKTLSGKRYYFGADGKAYKGIQDIDGYTYFFNTRENYLVKGLASLNGNIYYFNDTTYKIEKNTTKIIAGKVKVDIDSSGIVYNKEKLDDSSLAKVIYAGLDKMGTRYSHDTEEGLNCSSFITTILEDAKLNVFPSSNLKSHTQALYCKENNLVLEDFNDLQPGDLIFYNNDNCKGMIENGYCSRETEDGMRIHHVAMYIGDGKIIESTEVVAQGLENDGVRIADLNLTKSDTFYAVMAARVLE